MKRLVGLSLLFAAAGILSAVAAVGTGYSLFGSATYVSPGNNSNRAVQLTSNDTANPAVYSGIDFSVPPNLTINDLNQLSTDYDFTASSCGGGSPRFGITLAGHSGTIFVYIGPPANYTNCPQNTWTNTGNLLSPTSLVDASQLGGGQYEAWSAAQTQFTGAQVTDIFLVSDYGPSPSHSQTVLIDNTDVNGAIYDYEFSSPNDCKNNGYQNFTYAPGPFKNQGQCVSYFEHQK